MKRNDVILVFSLYIIHVVITIGLVYYFTIFLPYFTNPLIISGRQKENMEE